jgi:class 3 adenylate cyclase
MINSEMHQRLSSILTQKQQIGFILLDEQLVVLHASDWIESAWQVNSPALVGNRIMQAFPELLRMEAPLSNLIANQGESIIIPKIHHEELNGPGKYYSLEIEPFYEFGASLMISVTNITKQVQQEWCLKQQRKDLFLLSTQLDDANTLMSDVLHHLLPKSVANTVIETKSPPKPGGNLRKETTILFADMRNFTPVAEKLEPEQAVAVLNAYMTVIVQAIRRHQGTIIQIVGDMVMATFNLPDEMDDHAQRAVIAALDIRDSLEKYVEEERASDVPALGFGIGICTGIATAGYLGSDARYRYSVVGDVTNIAFHLCSRAAAGQIILSHETLMQLDNRYLIKPLGLVNLKRRKSPLRVYELQEIYEPPSIPLICDDSYSSEPWPTNNFDYKVDVL